MNDLFSLAGKVALVTGASRGLGWAMARGLAEAGGHVVLNGRHAEALEDRVRSLADGGLSASAAPFDVTDEAAGAAAVAATIAEHGHLDVLIANAGINHRAPLADFPLDEFRRVLETNLVACYALARAAASGMRQRGWGRIILTASIMGVVARPTIPAYLAAKGGLVALTKALAVELGGDGITANAIGPGFFLTEMNSALKSDANFDAWVKERTPLKRWAEPRELAGAAVFLASDAASYVNGHHLVVDGGMTINA